MRRVDVVIPPAFNALFYPYRHKAFYGGRGSAKSHSFATALVVQSYRKSLRIVCARQFQNSIADSVKELLEQKIKAFGINSFRSTEREIVNQNNGSRFTFIGLDRNPDSVKSLEGADICWVEEAHTINARSLDILTPTVRKPGSELWWSWNPSKSTDPVDAMLRGPIPPTKSYVKRVSWRDNPFFHATEMPAELQSLRLRDPLKYEHVWEGAYRKTADAQVLKNWRVGRLAVPDNARPRFGLDFGFSVDPTAAVKFFLLDGGKTLFIASELYAANVSVEALPAWLDRMTEIRQFRVTADSARPELIDHLRRNGFIVTAAIKGKNSIVDGLAWLQARDIVVDPACMHTIRELTEYSYEIDRITGAVLPTVNDEHNNLIDALRYGSEDDRRGPMTIGGRLS